MTLIGITGTMGAGKGTLVEYLTTAHGFTHYSARAFLIDEIKRQGLPVDRDSMIAVSNELRSKHGPDYVVRELLARASDSGRDAIIESVLTTGEAAYLKERGAILLGIDADRRVRYERICARHSETDRVSYEKFVEQEERKMHSNDPGTHNIAGVMAMADAMFLNNGTIDDLERSVRDFLVSRGVIQF